jgi:hypothetical protein
MSEQPDGALPDDPMTVLAQGAASAHELFTAYVTAGFTRAEALQLIVAVMVAHIQGAGAPQ